MRRPKLPPSALPMLLVGALVAIVLVRWIGGSDASRPAADPPPGPAAPTVAPADVPAPGTHAGAQDPSPGAANGGDAEPPPPPRQRARVADDAAGLPSGGDLPWIDALSEGLRRAGVERRLCLVYLQRAPDT